MESKACPRLDCPSTENCVPLRVTADWAFAVDAVLTNTIPTTPIIIDARDMATIIQHAHNGMRFFIIRIIMCEPFIVMLRTEDY